MPSIERSLISTLLVGVLLSHGGVVIAADDFTPIPSRSAKEPAEVPGTPEAAAGLAAPSAPAVPHLPPVQYPVGPGTSVPLFFQPGMGSPVPPGVPVPLPGAAPGTPGGSFSVVPAIPGTSLLPPGVPGTAGMPEPPPAPPISTYVPGPTNGLTNSQGLTPPPGTLGQTYQRRTRMLPDNKHPRIGMIDVWNVPESSDISARGMKPRWIEDHWRLETELPLTPGVPHIYAITMTQEKDGQKTVQIRWVRLIMGRIVDLEF